METSACNYLICNNEIFDSDRDTTTQQAAQRASQVGLNLLLNEGYPSSRPVYAPAGNQASATVVTVGRDSDTSSLLFTYLMIRECTRPSYGSYFMGGCGSTRPSIGSEDCGSDGAKACAVLILVLAVVALIASTLVAAGISIAQGVDADDVRKQIKLLKQELNKTNNSSTAIQEVYKQAISFQKVRYVQKSFTATITGVGFAGGFGTLTTAAIFAILIVTGTTSTSLFIPQVLAIAGGGAVIGGIGAQVSNAIIFELIKAYKSKKLEQSLRQLNSLMITPEDVLNSQEGNTYFDMPIDEEKIIRWMKEGDRKISYYVLEGPSTPPIGYTKIAIKKSSKAKRG